MNLFNLDPLIAKTKLPIAQATGTVPGPAGLTLFGGQALEPFFTNPSPEQTLPVAAPGTPVPLAQSGGNAEIATVSPQAFEIGRASCRERV